MSSPARLFPGEQGQLPFVAKLHSLEGSLTGIHPSLRISIVTETTYLTPDRILEYPNFREVRDNYINAVLELYEFRPSSIELMRDGGRIMVYATVMALWGGYRENEPASFPTISLLKKTVGLFNIASPRQIDLILARFTQVGHLDIRSVPTDLRVRVALPTPALIEHDRSFIRAHYSALGDLVGRAGYVLPLSGDLAYLKAMRGAWIVTLERMAREIVIPNPSVLRFYAASAGMLMLMRLVQMQALSPDSWIPVDYSDLSRRFGVSRTHIRTLLKTAAGHGDIEMDQRRRCLRLLQALRLAFDRNIAGRMSLLDRAHLAAVSALRHAPASV